MGLPDFGFGNAVVASAAEVTVTAGAFTLKGNDLTENTDYTYADNVLTIISEKNITVSGTTTTDKIVVKSGVSATITLDNVNIDVSGTDNACAFKIEDNSTGNVTIDLIGDNTLKSGRSCAGLQKNGTGDGIGKLTIMSTDGTGKLNATGGSQAAGIGGVSSASGSNITITGGVIIATSGNYGAGIGGGANGQGNNITISGGTVTANGKDSYYAIGGGYLGSSSNIIISGGSVRSIANNPFGSKDGEFTVPPPSQTAQQRFIAIASTPAP